MSKPDVLVLGGGVIGLAAAWRMAQQGLRVTVADPAPGSAASRAAAGMLAPVTEAHYEEEALLGLNLHSAGLYPDFCAELEEESAHSTGFLATPTLAVAADADDYAALVELHRYQTSLGLVSQRLTSRECRAHEPSLSPTVRGGLLVEGDHQVDPRRLVQALLAACLRRGVTLVRARAEAVVWDAGGCRGARLGAGPDGPPQTVEAGTTVLAAGVWSNEIALGSDLPPGCVPPIRPVKGQILRLRPWRSAQLLNATVRGLVSGSAVYLVPRQDGEVVIGATMEEQGSDTTVTAGAVHQLLRDAYALVPDVAEMELSETSAALRPCSPDNSPVIGPSALDGLVVAAAHYRNGMLLTPVTAWLVAQTVLTGDAPEIATPFLPGRFSRLAA